MRTFRVLAVERFASYHSDKPVYIDIKIDDDGKVVEVEEAS